MKRFFEKSFRLAIFLAKKAIKYLILAPILGLLYLLERLIKVKDWCLLNKLAIMEYVGFSVMFVGFLACINDYPPGQEPDFIIILRNSAIGLVMVLIGYRLYKASQKLQKNHS